jgi:hypothetical protein
MTAPDAGAIAKAHAIYTPSSSSNLALFSSVGLTYVLLCLPGSMKR